jgi:hypothetical protein
MGKDTDRDQINWDTNHFFIALSRNTGQSTKIKP